MAQGKSGRIPPFGGQVGDISRDWGRKKASYCGIHRAQKSRVSRKEKSTMPSAAKK